MTRGRSVWSLVARTEIDKMCLFWIKGAMIVSFKLIKQFSVILNFVPGRSLERTEVGLKISFSVETKFNLQSYIWKTRYVLIFSIVLFCFRWVLFFEIHLGRRKNKKRKQSQNLAHLAHFLNLCSGKLNELPRSIYWPIKFLLFQS